MSDAGYQLVYRSPTGAVTKPSFAVAADDSTARYVLPAGATNEFMNDARIKRLLAIGTPPATPQARVQRACANLSYVTFGQWTPADSLDDAAEAAKTAL